MGVYTLCVIMSRTTSAGNTVRPTSTNSEVEAKTAKAAAETQADMDPSRSWLVPIVTAVLLALAFCLYYFVYVGARREYLVNRNFRSLAALGANIQRVASTHGSILEFYADLRQPPKGKEPSEEERSPVEENKFLLIQPEDKTLERREQLQEARKDYLHFLAPNLKLVEAPVNRQVKAPPRLDIWRRDGRWELALRANRHQNARNDYFGSLEIEGLLTVPARSLPFDDILLVSDDGRVVYQEKKAGPQFTTLGSLLKARVGAAENKPGGSDTQGGGSDNAKGGGNETSDGKKQEQGWQATSIYLTDVLLAGTPHKLFLQPVLIDINSDEPGSAESPREWVLCGLRAASALEWEALSISYTTVIGFTALFFAVCLGGPVLKVIFMNRRERFPLREVGFLSLFLVLLAGVFTLTALEIVDIRAASGTDAQLQSVGGALANNVHEDLQKMRDQLEEWCSTGDLLKDLKAVKKEEVIRHWGTGVVEVDTPPKATKYPFLSSAFWTDDDGHQVVKWSNSGYVTPMIPISGQRIFNEPKRIYLDGKGPPFSFDSVLPPNKLEYVAALTMSTTACRPGVDEDHDVRGDVAAGSAFLVGQPFSLIDPILPFGYGFALVDDTGMVLFDSDKTKDGQENFREENDWSKELYASTFGHASRGSLSISYLGKDYLAQVFPIPGVTGASWSLIVYADREAERTLALQTMSMAATLFLAILAVPAVIAAIWGFASRPHFAPEWIWPNRHRVTTYLYQICVYALLIAVFLFLGFRGPSEQIVISCAAVPYSALLLTYWCFRRYPSARYAIGSRDPVKSAVVPVVLTVLSITVFLLVVVSDLSHLKALVALLPLVGLAALPLLEGPRRNIAILDRRWQRLQAAGTLSGVRSWLFGSHATCYAVSVLLLLLLIGVLTPMALFRASLAVERRLSVKREQLHLASALAERRAAILEKCAAGELGDATCEEFHMKECSPDALCPEPVGIWEKIVLNPSKVEFREHAEVVPQGAAGRGPREELYADRFRSLIYLLHHEYNATAAETLAVIPDRIPPKPGRNIPDWFWVNSPSAVELRWHGVQPLPSQSGSGRKEKDLVITSDVSAPNGGVLTGIAIALCVMLVIGGVLWMMVRKVFLIHIAPLKMTGAREVAECIYTVRNVLILVPPGFSYTVESPAATLDLKEIATEAKWEEKVDLERLSGLIAIRHFEYTSEVATIDQKLTLVRRLTQRERNHIAAVLEAPASTEDYRRMFAREDLELTVVDLRDEPFYWKKQYEGPAPDLIWEECWPMAALWPLGAQLAKEIRQETNVSADTVASEMLERAGGYYRLFWQECTSEQKFVLFQLAEDGMMNPMNGQEIRSLIRRGVIARDPQFRIMNESFRRFVCSATTPKMKQRWLADSRRSGWGKVHGAFFTTMIVLGVFLLTTQNALWQSSAAYVTGAFGALGTLAKLFNTYRGTATGEKAN